MRYLEKPTHSCPICGKSRRWADHTECSKKLQEMHKADKRPAKNKKAVSKTSELYFAELLKRIGD